MTICLMIIIIAIMLIMSSCISMVWQRAKGGWGRHYASMRTKATATASTTTTTANNKHHHHGRRRNDLCCSWSP